MIFHSMWKENAEYDFGTILYVIYGLIWYSTVPASYNSMALNLLVFIPYHIVGREWVPIIIVCIKVIIFVPRRR